MTATFSGIEALSKALTEGKKVRQQTWVNGQYVMVSDGKLRVFSTDGNRNSVTVFIPTTGELLATNWEEVDSKPAVKHISFAEALAEMDKGNEVTCQSLIDSSVASFYRCKEDDMHFTAVHADNPDLIGTVKAVPVAAMYEPWWVVTNE